MYKCEKCDATVSLHNHELHLVTETRFKAYPPRQNANPRMKKVDRCVTCKETKARHRHLDHAFRDPSHDPGGQGRETVHDLKVCGSCYGEWHDLHDVVTGEIITSAA